MIARVSKTLSDTGGVTDMQVWPDASKIATVGRDRYLNIWSSNGSRYSDACPFASSFHWTSES